MKCTDERANLGIAKAIWSFSAKGKRVFKASAERWW